MTPRFISERIEVTTTGTVRQPVSFIWRNQGYRVTKILLSWTDWNFPPGATKRDWRNRRHRNYHRVQTDTDEVYEIYYDRSATGAGGEWYLFQQLDLTE